MLHWLKKYFTITKREFNGMLVLLILMLLIFIFPYIMERITYQPISVKIEAIEPILHSIEKKSDSLNYSQNLKASSKVKFSKAELFAFNPNILNLEGWMKLGLSEKQAKPIINYINKGGRFYKPDDLKKMFTISSSMYQRLLPYVDIPVKENIVQEAKTAYKNNITVIDLNLADSASLTSLKGIGPTFASRIVKYRNKIGGFYSSIQLLEVYGFDSIKYHQLKNYFTVNDKFIQKVNINFDDFTTLKKIPYLSYKQINAIIAYRKQHGNYTSFSDLEQIKILNQEIINKIKPYVLF